MTKYKILRILRKKDEFISGEYLSKIIGVSRTSIWKGIKSLREKGYCIEGISNKGYRLNEDKDDIISEYEIKELIPQKFLGKNIYYFETITSTNEYALMHSDKLEDGDIIIADEQILGRGRMKKVFYSPKEAGIYMSIFLNDELFYDSLRFLSISVLNSVCRAIEKLTTLKVTLRWNEFIINGKKVGGLLTESIFEGETGFINSTVIGIGLNANNVDFPKTIDKNMTSLKLELGTSVNRKELIGEIIKECEKYIKIYLPKRKEILKEYLERMDLKNKNIEIKIQNRKIIGKVLGLNNKGGIIIVKEDNKKEIFYHGDISIIN